MDSSVEISQGVTAKVQIIGCKISFNPAQLEGVTLLWYVSLREKFRDEGSTRCTLLSNRFAASYYQMYLNIGTASGATSTKSDGIGEMVYPLEGWYKIESGNDSSDSSSECLIGKVPYPSVCAKRALCFSSSTKSVAQLVSLCVIGVNAPGVNSNFIDVLNDKVSASARSTQDQNKDSLSSFSEYADGLLISSNPFRIDPPHVEGVLKRKCLAPAGKDFYLLRSIVCEFQDYFSGSAISQQKRLHFQPAECGIQPRLANFSARTAEVMWSHSWSVPDVFHSNFSAKSNVLFCLLMSVCFQSKQGNLIRTRGCEVDKAVPSWCAAPAGKVPYMCLLRVC
jgi:hypothetical protein